MMILAAAAVAWTAVGLLVALGGGRMIALRDRRETPQDLPHAPLVRLDAARARR